MNDSQFDLPQWGPSSDQYAMAREWLGQELNFPEIRSRLLAQKTKPEFVEQVVIEVAAELVKPLVIGGVNPKVIQARLTARGMTREEVERVQEFVLAKHGRQLGSLGIYVGPRYAVGAVVITVGSVLWIGNSTGLFPTVPGLGFVTILAGMLIFGLFHLYRR